MTDTCPRCGGILIEGEALCARCAGGKGEGKPRVQHNAAGRNEAPGKGATRRDKLKDYSLVGKAIGGKYKVLEVLGQGGFGTVYLVEITVGMVGERLALKILPEELSTQETFRNQFLDEIRIAMRLVDRNIVQVRDVGVTEDGILYYTMDFCPGTTLAQMLHADGAIPISRTLLIVLNVLRGLQTAHAAGIVHRDLKPANIMVELRGGKDIVRVLDFGIATAIKVDGDKPRPFGGSPHYMPPEQFMGEPVNFYTDIYSIGVILYECLTGERPYPGETPQEVFRSLKSRVPPPPETLNPEISRFPGLSALVMKCIERNPERRFQSARELFDAVQAVLLRGTSIDQPPSAPLATRAPSPPGPAAAPPRPAPPRIRRRRVRRARGPAHAGAVALATLILAAVVVAVIFNAEIARWWRTRGGSIPGAPTLEPRENPLEKPRGTEGEKESNAKPSPLPRTRGWVRQDDKRVAEKPLSGRKAGANAQISERTRSLISEGNEALRSGDWKAPLYEGWAAAYHRAGNLIRAAQLYRSAYDVDPSPESCLQAARAHVAANPRSPEAREILEEGRKRFGDQRGFEEASKALIDDLTRR
ncbi:MAG TPA: protein kinase [Planctomycetota bacterium]|nr:protein kinase [Planctomycetota bacterium]